MKRKARSTAILLAAVTLCGCAKIPDLYDPVEQSVTSETSSGVSDDTVSDTETTGGFAIIPERYLKKLEAEKGAFSGNAIDENGEICRPDDGIYVHLRENQYLTQVATMTVSQFYRVIIAARSEKGASIKLQVGDQAEGAYYIGADSADGDFSLFAVDNLYMPVGLNTLKLTVERGDADIDYIIAENSSAVDSDLYKTGNACASPDATAKTTSLMKTLSHNYGKLTFTAQNVSCGTNAEIDAVYAETGRYPAIRTGELAPLMKEDDLSAELIKKELELAKQWDADGGICSFIFHWYSPNIIRSVEAKMFDLSKVFEAMEPSELSKLDDETIKYQVENDIIPEEAANVLADLDKLAETLKDFEKSDVPILFEPIPDGDAGLFWWGADAESYKELWELMFLRLCGYHKLKNLIWVWNNSSFDYYPGDKYVDIIGQSFYENTASSFAGRFSALGTSRATGRKMLAVTACDTLPNVSFMFRDNAIWLWTAPDSGDYMINASGGLSDKYTRKAALLYTYNNEKCVTRDELEKLWAVEG